MKESLDQKKKRTLKIIRRLRKTYPEARCALHFSNAWELLVATILSAQCTDKRVNMVTPALFQRFRAVYDFAEAGKPNASALREEVETLIHSTGFYKNKAKNIVGAAEKIVNQFSGKVPDRLEDLVTLPGVGRKTANVVLGNAFGIPGLTVDTHMIRLNRRLGFTKHTDPVKIEFELMKIVPQKEWTMYSHWIIHHGRSRCPARKPDCGHCEIKELCPSAGKA